MKFFTVMMSVTNQIYDLVEKAVEANMLSVHTDTVRPLSSLHGRAKPSDGTINYVYEAFGSSLEQISTDLRTDQHTAEDSFF